LIVGLALGAPTGAQALVPAQPDPPTVGFLESQFVPERGVVFSLARYGTTTYAGGNFTKVSDAGGVFPRTHLAAIGADGRATPLNLAISGDYFDGTAIHALAATADSVYIGGEFTSIGGVARKGLARYDLATGAIDADFPDVDNVVFGLDLAPDGSVYAAGNFAPGVIRIKADHSLDAAFNASLVIDSSGTEEPATVYAVEATASGVYAGGDFNEAGADVARSRVALLDNAGAPVAGFAGLDDADGYVDNLLLTAGGLLVAGSEPKTNEKLVKVDAASGDYIPGFDFNAAAEYGPEIGVIGNDLYAFSTMTSVSTDFGAFDLATGAPKPGFAPVIPVNEPVYAIDTTGGALYVGGEFQTIDGKPYKSFATFGAPPPVLPKPPPSPPVVVPDRRAAIVTAFKLAKRKFSRRKGTKVSFRSDEAGTATFAVTRKKGRRYRRFGSFKRAVKAGRNSFTFKKVGKKRLKTGRYRLKLTVKDAAGNLSKPRTVSFRVTR
jgi:hypothetical protein